MNSSAYPNSSPFNNNPTHQHQQGGQQSSSMLSSLKGIFSGGGGGGGGGDTLPFSYADASHTKTSTASWLPTFITSSPLMSGGTPSLATSTPLTATQEWLETMGLTRTQRYSAFAISIVAAIFLLFLALLHLPFVVIRPSKFVVPYCMGSMFILVSFGFLHGFVSYSKHLMSRKKVVYSAWFFLATLATLYSALSLKSYILTVLMALIQMVGMLTFIISYVPGGPSGISFMSSMISSSIKSRFSPNSF